MTTLAWTLFAIAHAVGMFIWVGYIGTIVPPASRFAHPNVHFYFRIFSMLFWEIVGVVLMIAFVFTLICRFEFDHINQNEWCPGKFEIADDGSNCICHQCGQTRFLHLLHSENKKRHNRESERWKKYTKTWRYRWVMETFRLF
jgi:hypothetical protein